MSTINCQEACVNGCVLGPNCPHLPYLAETKKFLENTSIDRMLQIAADRFAKYAPQNGTQPDKVDGDKLFSQNGLQDNTYAS